jgi:hypothetical protein
MNDGVVSFEVDYGDGSRSRGWAALGIFNLKSFALFPHLIIVGALQTAAFILAYVGYFMILFTGHQPDGINRFIANTIGWYTRVSAFLGSTTDEYPPFEFDAVGYPARFEYTPDESERSKGWALAGVFFVKMLAAIPHLVALAVVQIVAFIGAWFGYWVILFTGTHPKGIHDFVAGAIRWGARVSAWITSLTDVYPPFSLE